VRSSGFRASRHQPATHTGTSSGLTRTSWKGTNRYHGSLVPELPPAMASASSSCGQPFAACHTRFGIQIASASRPPSHGQGERRAERGPTARIPTTTAARRNAGCTLFCRATPATTPVTSQTGPPSRSARTSSHESAVHASRSGVVVESR
jgi:hypothetical protein